MNTNSEEILERLNSNQNLLTVLSPVEEIGDEDKGEIPSQPSEDNILSIHSTDGSESLSLSPEMEAELDKLLASTSVDLSSVINNERSVGRPKGSRDKSNEDRADLGVLGTTLGYKEASKLTQTSTAQSWMHERGRVNFKDEDGSDVNLTSHYRRRISHIRDKVSGLIVDVINRTEDAELIHKITSAKDAVNVMQGLAGVLERTESKVNNQNAVIFQIYAPQVASESDYETIDVAS